MINGAPLAEVSADVLAAARSMLATGLVQGTAGNVSGRVDDGSIVVTPAGMAYDVMTLDDLVVVSPDRSIVDGSRAPTSELHLHLDVMAAHPEVGGVVHTHARHASMFAVTRQPVTAAIDELVLLVGGDVPVCPYHPSGSDALGTAVADALVDRSAALLANHGMVTIGRSVDEALRNAAVVEHDAAIVWGARSLGEVVDLPETTVLELTARYAGERRRWHLRG